MFYLILVASRSQWHFGQVSNCARPFLFLGLQVVAMGFKNCGLCMRRQCRERFPHHRLRRKPLVIHYGMHHGTFVTHVLWCMSGSMTRGGGENVPCIPGPCATCNFTFLVKGPCEISPKELSPHDDFLNLFDFFYKSPPFRKFTTVIVW